MKNFKNVIKKVDYWELRYNGNENCEVVARGTGDILDILDDALYNKFKKESK